MHSILLIFLFLVGCGGGGPSGPRTPIGGIGQGSTKSYYCRGEWHYPQTFYEYDQTGLASWYGPGFHGKPKPYGEAFDMNGISAAHRTLPLPTVVRVTNLQSGKSINLVVDDRGPFVYEGRIIDLSAGAAKALGTYSKGLTNVRVQSLPGESRRLSDYLAQHGNTKGKMKDGRTWQKVYQDEIAGGQYSAPTVNPIPISAPESNPIKSVPIIQKQTKPLPDPLDGIDLSPDKADSVDDIVNSLANEEVASPAKLMAPAQSNLTMNTYINLGETYVQKANAQKVANSLPKDWKPSVEQILHPSGQTFYSVKIGPLKNKVDAQKILKNCQTKGHNLAMVVND